MTDLLLQLVADYGLPILAVTIFLACLGIPVPGSILLVLAGAFVPSGDIQLISLLAVALITAVVGDHVAYFIGIYGGGALERRLAGSPKSKKQMERAQAFSKKWGGVGVFLSRWLVAPVGPWINYASGLSRYSLFGFLIWDILGEIIWVGVYVTLGVVFSSNAIALAGVLGDISWMLLGLIAVWMLGSKLYKVIKAMPN